MNYLIVNGEIHQKKEINLSSFLLNDFFTITVKTWYGFGGIPLFHENLENIYQQLNELEFEIPAYFKNTRELFRLSKRMLNKNKYFRSGIINIRVFWSEKKFDTLITCSASDEFDFPFNVQGLLVDFSKLKIDSGYSQLSLINRQLFRKMALLKTGNNSGNEAIVFNQHENLCESTSGNIFLLKNNTLITPAPEAGCSDNILRRVILQIAKKIKLQVIETPDLKKDQLLQTDEVFFASEENGIQWILGINNRRFMHETTDKLYKELNTFLKNKVAK